MNAGIVPPDPGYLEGVRRLTREHGVLLAFDEVKTGLTVGPGGATALFGVQPDIVCLAKALGGGVPCGAIGGTAEVMAAIVDGAYQQVGTFNGNPLTMAAARAMLTEVLTPDAYAHFDRARPSHASEAHGTALRRAGVPGLRAPLRGQGCDRVPPHAGARLPRVPRRPRRAEPRPLARAAQRRRLPAAVGQERAVDAVGAAHDGRRRPLHRQRRAVRRGARRPRPLGERRRPSPSTTDRRGVRAAPTPAGGRPQRARRRCRARHGGRVEHPLSAAPPTRPPCRARPPAPPARRAGRRPATPSREGRCT